MNLKRDILAITLRLVTAVHGTTDIVEEAVLYFGATTPIDISNLNDDNVATNINLQDENSSPWFMTFKLKAMTANQDIVIKSTGLGGCAFEHVYATVDTQKDGSYTKCEIKKGTATESDNDVCKYDCGAHITDPTGSKALVRISHAPAGATISEIQYENP